MIVVLDFGSQYTQLIAKKIRYLGFEARVFPGVWSWEQILKDCESVQKAHGIVLSGSPLSVNASQIKPHESVLNRGLPMLGICFAYQFFAKQMGGQVSSQSKREYGMAQVQLTERGQKDALFQGVSSKTQMWMSHGDSVVDLPTGAERLVSSGDEIAGFYLPEKKLWALQFHPEVEHSKEGKILFQNFCEKICKLEKSFNSQTQFETMRLKIEKEIPVGTPCLLAASGGVDSTVAAALVSQVREVEALYVDHGFNRGYDLADLKKVFAGFPHIKLRVVDAKEKFWKELKGVSDPETKRKIIGRLFIEVFQSEVKDPEKYCLIQGTIYSDVIESAGSSSGLSAKIKSHHNVGGLPKDVRFCKIVEPLRDLFKDEVRAVGALLGIDKEFLNRHPFPGPGLAIRVVGELQPEKVEILRKVDEIFIEEIKKQNLYEKTWQAGAMLLPTKSVGVQGDERSYESVVALRAVTSTDAMTVEACEYPWEALKVISTRICNEVRGVNRVVYDLSSKPPATIEWE